MIFLFNVPDVGLNHNEDDQNINPVEEINVHACELHFCGVYGNTIGVKSGVCFFGVLFWQKKNVFGGFKLKLSLLSP